jgi:hypothetical protein
MPNPSFWDQPGSAYAVSQFQSCPISWLWPGRLALAKLALLDGDPELGKSLLTLDLCARLSTGRPWPDGQPAAEPAASLILNGEDNAGDTIRPRLQTLGADLERIFLLPPRGKDLRPPLLLPGHTTALADALRLTQARLLVIDPVTAFLDPALNTAADSGMRSALAPLMGLAEDAHCAVLMVRHLNKAGGIRALYRGLGSIGLIAVCRLAWLLVPDVHNPGRRVLAQVKNNLAPPQPSLAFSIQPADNGLPQLTWHGPTDLSADTLLADLRARIKPRDAAREFLLQFLHDGARTSADIWQQGQSEGLSHRTLQRVCKDMQICIRRVRENDRSITYWKLPGYPWPPALQAQMDADPLEPWLGPLRERTADNPLDDF